MAEVEKININSTDYDIADAKALRTKDNVGTNSFVDTRAGTTTYPTTGANLNYSTVIGDGAYITSNNTLTYTTVIGNSAYSNSSYSTSLGGQAHATNVSSVAIGYDSGASGSSGVAVGANSRASNTGAVAVGRSASAGTQYGVAVGYGATAAGNSYSTAVGGSSSAGALYAASFGGMATASSTRALALGYGASASSQYACAIGSGAAASNNNAVQLGQGTNANYGSLQFRNWTLVNNEGKIPEERLPEGIKTATSKVPNLYNISQEKVTEQSILYTGTTNDSITNSMFYRGRLREGYPTFNCSWVDNEWIDSYQDVYIDQQKLFTKLAEVTLDRINNDDVENGLIGGGNSEQTIYLYYDADNANYFIRFDSDSFEAVFNHTPDDITGLSFDDFADYGIYINNFHKPEDVEGEYEFCDIYYYAPIYCDSYDWNDSPSYINYFTLIQGLNDGDWGVGRVISSMSEWSFEVDGTTYYCPVIPETYEYDGSEYDNIEFRWEWTGEDWEQFINGEDIDYSWSTSDLYSKFGIYVEQGEEENVEHINLNLRGAVQRYWEQFNPIDDSVYALASQLTPIQTDINELKEWSVQTITGTKNLNDYKTEGWYKFVGSSITNRPNNVNSPILMLVIKANNVDVKQFIFAPSVTSSIGGSGYSRYAPSIFHRVYLNGTWSSWNTILNNDSANFLNNYNANIQQKLVHRTNSPILNWVADTTVNDSTISFTQGGVSKGSFTLNQSTGATIALDGGSNVKTFTSTCPALAPSSGICSWTVTHNLGSNDVITALYNSSNNKVEHNVNIVSQNELTIAFLSDANVSADDYKIVIIAL